MLGPVGGILADRTARRAQVARLAQGTTQVGLTMVQGAGMNTAAMGKGLTDSALLSSWL